jgi:hypothetical protein
VDVEQTKIDVSTEKMHTLGAWGVRNS